MKILKNLKGVSAVEALVAISIFSIVAVASSNLMINIVKAEKRSGLQNAIFADTQAILQRITNEIQNGTISFDDYYDVCVVQSGCSDNSPDFDPNAIISANPGVYASRFYDPGLKGDGSQGSNPTDLGIECSYPDPLPVGEDCEITNKDTVDANTGRNPFAGSDGDPEANAFCENGRGSCDFLEDDFVSLPVLVIVDESGTKKTVLARQKIRDTADGGDWAVGIVEMEGEDYDQNGIVDTFKCTEDYNCYGDGVGEASRLADKLRYLEVFEDDPESFIVENDITLPTAMSWMESFFDNPEATHYIPISPLRANVEALHFIVTPLEDPYKAFNEDDLPAHPTVTVILTLGLSSEAAENFPGEFQSVTVQTTVAAGVVERIETYPAVNDIREGGDASWISDVMPPTLETSF